MRYLERNFEAKDSYFVEAFALVESHHEMEWRQGLGKTVEDLWIGNNSRKYINIDICGITPSEYLPWASHNISLDNLHNGTKFGFRKIFHHK